MSQDAARILRTKDDVVSARAHADGRARAYKVNVQNLYIEVFASGRGSYYHQYYVREGGRRFKRKTVLGQRSRTASELESVKKQADALNAQVASGNDPVLAARKIASTLTVAELCALRLEAGDLSDETRSNYAQYYRADIVPMLGHFPADSVTMDHVKQVRKTVKDRGALTQADRVVSAIGGLYKWARREGHASVSPTVGVEKLAKYIPREVSYTDDEIRHFWRESGTAFRNGLGVATRITLLTGLRRAEVIKARRDQVDLENAVLTLEAAKTRRGRIVHGSTKNKQEHIVPLSTQVVVLFKEALELANGHDYVFPARKGATIYPHLDPNSATRGIGRIRANGSEVTLHDMRRTVATWVGEDDDFLVVKRILGHTGHDVTTRVYMKSSKLAAVRLALQRWADHVESIVA